MAVCGLVQSVSVPPYSPSLTNAGPFLSWLGIGLCCRDGQEWLFGFNIKIKNLEIPWKYQYQNQDCWNWQKIFKINIKILEKIWKNSISISNFLKCLSQSQYQYQDFWNVYKISKPKSILLKRYWNIQYQNQNSWKFHDRVNIKIKIKILEKLS